MNDEVKNEINIDSLLLRLPLNLVEVIDNSLTDTYKDYLVNETTGEHTPIVAKYKQSEFRRITINREGYKFQFQIKSLVNRYTGVKSYYLYMLLNAKMLESRYLEGITANNIQEIYKNILSCKLVLFSFEDFLNKSKCTSIDFCKNFNIRDLRRELIQLKEKILKTPKNNPIPNLKKNNKEDSLRFIDKEKATQAKPHIFIYNKEKELVSNSYSFMGKYLKNKDITDLCRIEYRVKNKKHLKYLGIPDTNLGTLLKLPQLKKEQILHKFTMCYLEKPKPKNQTKLTPTKMIYLNALRTLTQAGNNFGIAAEILLQDITPASRKSEKHKELKELYYDHIYQPIEVARNNVEIYDIMELFHSPQTST